MKKISIFLIALLVPLMIFWTSCGGNAEDQNAKTDTVEVAVEINHTQLLLDEIVKNGDFINTKRVPTMIKSQDVNDAVGGNILVIDIRKAKDYASGHIKGAVNVKLGGLIDYIKINDIKAFEKVVMVCYSGQEASFATSVLQILGHNNVYAMKWGMSSWNKKFAGKWLENISDKYADQLETNANAKNTKGELPKFDCERTNGAEILEARAAKILADGYKDILITADEIFGDPGMFYIVNYWPAKAYNIGHINGSVRYQPKSSLNTGADLLTLPTDKKILTYCYTGQHSAFVTAYLRILGYDAYSLKFGSNSFMNKMLIENEDLGHGFSKKKIHNFKFETSEYAAPKDGEEEEGGC